MLKFNILNRFSGAVQVTAEIDCKDSEIERIKLGLAVKWAYKTNANLGGAYLGGADLGGADLRGADLRGADLGGANLGGADLRGADLGGANLRGAYLGGAYLGGADLGGADLGGADLRGADLGGANLRGAYLGGAYLGGADLGGADLGEQWIIQGATRSDGYAFFLQKLKDDKEPMVRAGCRYLTLAQAQTHWTKTRKGTALFEETEIIVRSMVALAIARKLIPEAKLAIAEAA